MKKNKISIYFFGYFPVADMKKKKLVQTGWATAQIIL